MASRSTVKRARQRVRARRREMFGEEDAYGVEMAEGRFERARRAPRQVPTGLAGIDYSTRMNGMHVVRAGALVPEDVGCTVRSLEYAGRPPKVVKVAK